VLLRTLLWEVPVTRRLAHVEGDNPAPLVRPFILAHLAEVERAKGKRRRSAIGSQIIREVPRAVVTVALVPNGRGVWGFSPASGGGR
jgi:hypothetical protein